MCHRSVVYFLVIKYLLKGRLWSGSAFQQSFYPHWAFVSIYYEGHSVSSGCVVTLLRTQSGLQCRHRIRPGLFCHFFHRFLEKSKLIMYVGSLWPGQLNRRGLAHRLWPADTVWPMSSLLVIFIICQNALQTLGPQSVRHRQQGGSRLWLQQGGFLGCGFSSSIGFCWKPGDHDSRITHLWTMPPGWNLSQHTSPILLQLLISFLYMTWLMSAPLSEFCCRVGRKERGYWLYSYKGW